MCACVRACIRACACVSMCVSIVVNTCFLSLSAAGGDWCYSGCGKWAQNWDISAEIHVRLHHLVSFLQPTPRPTGETSPVHPAVRKDNLLLTYSPARLRQTTPWVTSPSSTSHLSTPSSRSSITDTQVCKPTLSFFSFYCWGTVITYHPIFHSKIHTSDRRSGSEGRRAQWHIFYHSVSLPLGQHRTSWGVRAWDQWEQISNGGINPHSVL